MTTCRQCTRPVRVGTARCPHCGALDPGPAKQRRTSPGRLLLLGSVVLVLLLGYLFVDRYRDGQARQDACQQQAVADGVQPGTQAFELTVAECVDES